MFVFVVFGEKDEEKLLCVYFMFTLGGQIITGNEITLSPTPVSTPVFVSITSKLTEHSQHSNQNYPKQHPKQFDFHQFTPRPPSRGPPSRVPVFAIDQKSFHIIQSSS